MRGHLFILIPILVAVAVIASSCSSESSPNNTASNGMLTLYVRTNTGGPSVGPLQGAPIKIENAGGVVVAQMVSDVTGHASVSLATGTYTIDPQRVPSNPTFYTPPQKSSVTIIANTTVTDTLHYENPIVRRVQSSSVR